LFEQQRKILSDKLLLFKLLFLSWEVLTNKLHPVLEPVWQNWTVT